MIERSKWQPQALATRYLRRGRLSVARIARLLPASDRRSAQQILWLGAMMAIKLLASIVQIALSARILGPDGLGVLGIIIAVSALMFGFITLPGHETITTFVTRSLSDGRRDEAAATLRLAILAPAGLAAVSYALLIVFAFAGGGVVGFDQAHRSTLLLYGVTGIFMATYLSSNAVLRLTDRLRLGFAITVASILTRVAVITAAFLMDGGLLMVVISYVAGSAVEGIGFLTAAAMSTRRAGLPGLWRSLSIRVPRDVVRFQIVTFLQTKAGALIATIDVILMAALTNTTQVGLYRAARQLIDTTRLPIEPITQGLQVEYSRRHYAAGGQGLRELAGRFTKLSVTLAVIVYGLLALFYEPIIRLVFGPEFTEMAQPLLILIPGAFAFMSIAALSGLPAATGRAEPLMIANWLGLAAMVTMILLLVPTLGAAGTAWANTAYYLATVVILTPFALLTLRRSLGRNPLPRTASRAS